MNLNKRKNQNCIRFFTGCSFNSSTENILNKFES